MCQECVEQGAQHTTLRAAVFMISVFEERGPMLTDCGLLVWKSMIQLQREGGDKAMSSLSVSVGVDDGVEY